MCYAAQGEDGMPPTLSGSACVPAAGSITYIYIYINYAYPRTDSPLCNGWVKMCADDPTFFACLGKATQMAEKGEFCCVVLYMRCSRQLHLPCRQ